MAAWLIVTGSVLFVGVMPFVVSLSMMRMAQRYRSSVDVSKRINKLRPSAKREERWEDLLEKAGRTEAIWSRPQSFAWPAALAGVVQFLFSTLLVRAPGNDPATSPSNPGWMLTSSMLMTAASLILMVCLLLRYRVGAESAFSNQSKQDKVMFCGAAFTAVTAFLVYANAPL